ncbi:MAG: exodeoxyribonuclease VII small subunit [Streptosporangiales bacterium]|nr:exodeoxyribonuclease VII small subunit [Streptosporangiales bacterium]
MTDNQQPEASYEQARAELVEVVRKLEAGGTTLEESLALWERGEELARTCQDWLDGARARLHQAMTDTDPDAEEPTAEADGDGEESGEAPPF